MIVKVTAQQMQRSMTDVLGQIVSVNGGHLAEDDLVAITNRMYEGLRPLPNPFLDKRLRQVIELECLWVDDNLIYKRPSGGWEFTIVEVASFLLPKGPRERWFSDSRQALQESCDKGHSRWVRSLIAIGRLCLFGIAAVRVRFKDLTTSGPRNTKLN